AVSVLSVQQGRNRIPHKSEHESRAPSHWVPFWPVLYVSAKMLREAKSPSKAALVKTSSRQVPKSKEPLPVHGAWITPQIEFIATDEQNPRHSCTPHRIFRRAI